jgi:hypothetical protein
MQQQSAAAATIQSTLWQAIAQQVSNATGRLIMQCIVHYDDHLRLCFQDKNKREVRAVLQVLMAMGITATS